MGQWCIVQTPEFGAWFASLGRQLQEDIYRAICILRELGPTLGRPYVDTIKGSRFGNMKELRVQSHGRPVRSLFAFDARRTGVLLIGGDKRGNPRFYETMVAKADELFVRYRG